MDRAEAIGVLVIEQAAHRKGGLVDRAIDMAIAALQEQESSCCKKCNSWIGVEERLPKRGQKVLCYMKYEPDSSDIVCDNTYNGPLVGTRGKTHVWQFDSDFVTHWMPLPEPPAVQPSEVSPSGNVNRKEGADHE